MGSVKDLIHRESSDDPLVQAIIAEDAGSWSQRVEVIIPSFDPGQKWGPCAWSGTFWDGSVHIRPSEGDECVIGFAATDEPGAYEPYIVNWWPYGG